MSVNEMYDHLEMHVNGAGKPSHGKRVEWRPQCEDLGPQEARRANTCADIAAGRFVAEVLVNGASLLYSWLYKSTRGTQTSSRASRNDAFYACVQKGSYDI